MFYRKQRAFRLIVICSVLCSLLTTTCLAAATWYPWGPQYFTPHTGTIGASSTMFEVDNLRWTQEQITQIDTAGGIGYKSLELECRPFAGTTAVDPHTLWNNSNVSFESNLPHCSFEFQDSDCDDIAIACNRLVEVEADTPYYGRATLTPKTGATFGDKKALFESEFGRYVGVDSYPIAYEQVFNQTSDSNPLHAAAFGSYYSWI